MKGRRRDDVEPHLFEDGDYGCWRGYWYGQAPGGQLANLTSHTIAQHDDGTITVAPSIRVTGGCLPEWHGFLEAGVWRTA